LAAVWFEPNARFYWTGRFLFARQPKLLKNKAKAACLTLFKNYPERLVFVFFGVD
jgi:hypothetical protein